MYLQFPASDDGQAVLRSLPRRLQDAPPSATGGTGLAAPPLFSTSLITHVILRVALFSLQVRSHPLFSSSAAPSCVCGLLLITVVVS
jgi:hypothetical protein